LAAAHTLARAAAAARPSPGEPIAHPRDGSQRLRRPYAPAEATRPIIAGNGDGDGRPRPPVSSSGTSTARRQNRRKHAVAILTDGSAQARPARADHQLRCQWKPSFSASRCSSRRALTRPYCSPALVPAARLQPHRRSRPLNPRSPRVGRPVPRSCRAQPEAVSCRRALPVAYSSGATALRSAPVAYASNAAAGVPGLQQIGLQASPGAIGKGTGRAWWRSRKARSVKPSSHPDPTNRRPSPNTAARPPGRFPPRRGVRIARRGWPARPAHRWGLKGKDLAP